MPISCSRHSGVKPSIALADTTAAENQALKISNSFVLLTSLVRRLAAAAPRIRIKHHKFISVYEEERYKAWSIWQKSARMNNFLFGLSRCLCRSTALSVERLLG